MTRRLPNALPSRAEDRQVPRGFDERSFLGNTYFVRKGYRLVPCEGACRNPMNDHCQSCAPLWGVKAVLDD